MPNPGQQLVPWTQEQWTAIQNAVDKALAATAKCRRVLPKGPDRNGEKAVVVPTIQAAPISYGPDRIVTPVHVFADANLDDGRQPAEIQRLIETTAALVGGVEDQEVILGPAGAPPPAPAGRVPRNGALARDGLTTLFAASLPPIPIAGGVYPTGAQLYAAITQAVAALEGAGRPGRFGLLVHNTLMATLQQPLVPGGVPLIQEVEGLIGSNKIFGTSALAPPPPPPPLDKCGVLLRLEPAAADLVHTQLPTVTVLGRAAGSTSLQVEEEIAVRILDPAAIQTFQY